MKFIKYLAVLWLAFILAACGGGGGAPGLPSGVSTPLITTAPASLTLAVSAVSEYMISGGRKPYQVASSNEQVSVASVSNSSLTISGVASGTASIVVKDATGQSTTVNVTVPAEKVYELYTTAPSSFTIAKDTQRIFTVGGGVPGYVAESTDTRIVAATLSGTALTIRGVAAGSANVLIRDKAGSLVTLNVTVGGDSPLGLYTSAPAVLTVAKGTQTTYSVGGGVPGYTVESSDRRIATVSLSGNSMVIAAVDYGATTITIRDSAGSTLSVALTVAQSTPGELFTSAPSALFMNAGSSLTYAVTGGAQPYFISSSDARVATGIINGTSLSITASLNGSAVLQIADSNGAKLQIVVTVAPSSTGDFYTTAPSTLSMGAGSSLSYLIGGGAQPYYVSSSDARVAVGSISGTTLTISALTTGSAGLQISDATGAKLQIAVTVDGPLPPTTVVAVSDFVLLLNKNSINNSGADSAQLTVTAVDVNRNVVAGASVVVSTDKNSIFTPNASTVTDASGVYTGTLTIGGDKTDRDVTLTVLINGITKRTQVRIEGSRLSIQALPSAPTPSQSMTVTATLIDSAGNPIPEAVVTFDGTVAGLQNVKLTTDLKGQVSKTLLAPTAEGVYTISASGSGVSAADFALNVFSSAVPVAVIPAGATPSLSASPNVLSVNSAGSTANQSTLRFLFLDSTNSPVRNVRVRFDDITTGLALVGASISSGTSTLYTDSSGTVSVQYIAGQNSSPTNGVTVRACYSANDFASTTACPNVVNVNLTTVGQALAVSIGDDNLLAKGTGGTYIKQFVVTVADSAGRAVVNAPVAIAVDLTHYGKGTFTSSYLDASGSPVNGLTVVPFDLNAAYPASTSTDPAVSPVQRIWCPNEDTNRNGNVDPTENINRSVDTNGQPTLDPRKADLIVSYADPAVTRTNANGVLVIKVEYSQRFGTWLAYRVIATTNVSGSQGNAERLFVTDVLAVDFDNGSFRTPPYGVGSCVSPN